MNFIHHFNNTLLNRVNASSLGLFRITVSFILFLQAFYFIQTDFVQVNLINTKVHFPFYYFQFLKIPSLAFLKFIPLVMLLSSAMMMLGKFFKLSTLVFFLSFTYLWLLDKSYFNNHYFFISILTFLLLFTKADEWGRIGAKNKAISQIPYWQVFVLKFQVLVVFFIAGINKLNHFWLMKYQPMKHIIETKASVNNYQWLNNESVYAFFSWSGCIFDLVIGFLLWNKRTRKFAIILYVAFNLMNHWLFHDIGEIGFFPFLLLACLTIFLDPKIVHDKLNWLKRKVNTEQAMEGTPHKRNVLIVVIIFMATNLLFPFRHVLYDGHVDWTGRGQRFAWRMKIMYKIPEIQFYLEDELGDKKGVNVGHFLNDKQYTNLIYYPDFIPPVAKHIKLEGMRRGMKNPKVTADFKIGFMGEPLQPLVQPTQDLSKVEFVPHRNNEWILSYKP